MDLNNIVGLFKSDYLDTLKQAEQLGGVDLIATSPPYADARTYGMDCSFTDEDYQRLAHGLWGALKPGGHALINLDAPVRDWTGDGRGTERGLHPDRFKIYAHDTVGFRLPDRLAYGRMGSPGAYSGRFRNDWEPLFWLQKPGGEPYLDKWPLVKEATFDQSQIQSGSRHSSGSVNTRQASGRAVEEGVKHRGTLWDYGAVAHGHTGAPDIEAAGHEARWPYKLARDIVLCFCPVNGIVCDPFVGAGTTMIAALEEGRRFIGGDLGKRRRDNKDWIEIAREIAVNRNKQTTLFG
jgi:DNA modification methylase